MFWFGDALLDTYVYRMEGTFADLLVFDVPLHEVYVRLLVLLVFLVFGVVVGRFVSRLEHSESRLARLNDVLAAIREVNQTIVRRNEEDAMVEDICRQLVSNRGYNSIWAVVFNGDGRRVKNAVHLQVEGDMEALADTIQRGDYPACVERALERNDVVVTAMDEQACLECPIHYTEQGTHRLTTPLRYRDKNYGIIAAAIEESGTLDDEISLFRELAGDMAYALHTGRLEDQEEHNHTRLRESEHRFRLLFETSRDPIVLTSETGAIIEANPAFSEMTGHGGTAVVGRKLGDYSPDPEQLKRFFDTLRRESYLKDSRLDLETAGGESLVCHVSATRRREMRGEPVYQIIIHDSTERERLERQLFQAQKMESIARLAGGVAHDFNNLLTAIMGNAELALMSVKTADPLRGDMEEILRTCRRAEALTRQLLAFSRRQIAEPRVLNINTTLIDMDRMLRRLIREDIELVTLTAPDLWNVKIDPVQVEQVLTNLVVNARDAMPRGGKLTIETANREIDENYIATKGAGVPGDYVMMAVSDTGEGMDGETMQHAFEPFFSTKKAEEGTGLGLSTCYGIVKQNGGFIWLYSEPGEGTTVKIYLPRSRDEVAAAVPADRDVDEFRGSERILLVEDEEAVRRMMVRQLGSAGYRVIEAMEGKEALRMIGESAPNSPDLLITDVIMPQMGGRDLADSAARIKPDMKILFISGYTDNSIVHHGFLEKGITFLQKPFSHRELLKKVRRLLDG